MQIQQLEYVLEVAKYGSMTKASKHLFVSQPTLTKSIANLEKEFGISIFDRTARGVRMTPQGKEFIYYAKNIMTSVNSLEKIFSSKNKDTRGTLSIASQQFDFLYDIIISTYEKFKDKTLHFNIEEVNRRSVINSVIEGDVNIGLLVCSTRDSKLFSKLLLNENIQLNKIGSSKVYASFGKKSPFYHRDSITFEELRNQTHVVLDMEDEVIQDLYIDKGYDIGNENLIFFNTVSGCLDFLLKTDSYLYTPKWVLGFFKDTGLNSIPVKNNKDEIISKNELVWIKRKNENLSTIENLFINELIKKIKND